MLKKYKVLTILSNQNLKGALVLVFLLLIFFSTPIFNYQTHFYSSADMLQLYQLPRIEENHVPKNVLISDTITDMQPWFMFQREMFRNGQFPLWNPYNANGEPLMGNFQSAVFAIFSLPFYILSFKSALLISSFMKLFLIGLFTFLFLKKLKLSQLAALSGATTFMFSGYNIVWLAYPLTSVVFMLPACLYFLEVIFEKVLLAPDATLKNKIMDNFGGLVGFSLSLTFGLLAGHPETFYFCFLLITAYILFRLFFCWKDNLYSRATLGRLVSLSIQIGAAGIIAAGLSMVQLLPFFEYLNLSAAKLERTSTSALHTMTSFIVDKWPLAFFPDLLGNPSSTFKTDPSALPLPNYNEVNGFYNSGMAVFLGLVMLFPLRKNRYVVFFGAVGVIWLFYFYKVLGTSYLFNLIPVLGILPETRSYPIWNFCLSCCVAFGLNHLQLQKAKSNLKITLTIIALGGLYLVVFLLGSYDLVEKNFSKLQPYVNGYYQYLQGHIWSMGLFFGVGLLALALLYFAHNEKAKTVFAGLILAVIFLQGGFLLKDYNPTIENKYFYPLTPAIEGLKQTIGNNRFIIQGPTLNPTINLAYKIPLLTNYDVISVNYYKQLYLRSFKVNSDTLEANQVTESGLKLFGVKYLLNGTSEGNPGILRNLSTLQTRAQKEYLTKEILPGNEISQLITFPPERVQAIGIIVTTFKRTNKCQLQFKLVEPTTNKTIVSQLSECQNLKDKQELLLNLPYIADSRGKQYQLLISSPDSKSGNAVAVVAKSDLNYAGNSLSMAGGVLPGGLAFQLYLIKPNSLEQVATLGNYNLYKYINSPGKYYAVGKALIAKSDQEVMNLLEQPDTDLSQVVVFSPGSNLQNQPQPASNAETPQEVTVISEKPNSVQLQITRESPGYLVMTKTFYPGWKAKVNGVEKPVLQANYAFSAVELGAGLNNIDFYYEPESFTIGFIVTAATTVLLLILSLLKIVKISQARVGAKSES